MGGNEAYILRTCICFWAKAFNRGYGSGATEGDDFDNSDNSTLFSLYHYNILLINHNITISININNNISSISSPQVHRSTVNDMISTTSIN